MSAKDKIVQIHDNTYTLSEASRAFQIPWSTIRQRYYNHDRGDRLVRPVKRITVTMDGKERTLGELALRYRLNVGTVKSRYYSGKRGPDLVRPVEDVPHQQLDNNRERTVNFHGHPRTFKALSKAYGIELRTIRGRFYRGDRDDDLVRPLGKSIRQSRPPLHVPLDGKERTFREIGRSYGIPVRIIKDRYYQGKKGPDLVRPPRKHFN